MIATQVKIKQESQYTFKYNAGIGRHGWLRLTPAYSVKLVEQIIDSLPYKPQKIFEPFSGTGTTELVCANRGIKSVAYEINPFLKWFAEVKSTKFSDNDIFAFLKTSEQVINEIESFLPLDCPTIAHIERWWNKSQLEFLSKLKAAIWGVKDKNTKNLLKVAFCRTVIELSNAAFNHVSTSFNVPNENDNFSFADGKICFSTICDAIAKTATHQPIIEPEIFCADSMNVDSCDTGKFDTVITSPPYPNRISYIRELRPYMYWLDYLKTADDASNLDWRTVGGTWGSATSKLSTWHQKTNLLPQYLHDIAVKISTTENKSAKLLANYVLKYFDDMAIHLECVFNAISKGGSVHYIVGNSNFYGNTVPSEQIYVDIMKTIGFSNPRFSIVRKRNCNKALYEFLISAEK